jgi:hypothetical protein
MHAVIRHSINDPAKWDKVTQNIKSMIEQGRLPKGVKPLEYLPSTDGRKADCVWEAETLASLQQFLDRETGTAARNEYFEVNAANAIGLPTVQPQLTAARA